MASVTMGNVCQKFLKKKKAGVNYLGNGIFHVLPGVQSAVGEM